MHYQHRLVANYSQEAAFDQLEDERELAQQKRRAEQYRREHVQPRHLQEYINEYW